MQIRSIQPEEYEAARRLLADNGFGGRVESLDSFRLLAERAQRAIVAIVDGQVVGFARALTDGVSNGYVSMLVVSAAHRRKGVGRALMHALMGDDHRLTWVLRSARPEARAFYERIGFVTSAVAMERHRERTKARGQKQSPVSDAALAA